MNTLMPTKLVRKCLFGTVDHSHVNRDLELKLHQISQEDTQRWNFIFKTETPLPGRLQWEKNPVDRVAAFYHESSWGENTSSATQVYEEKVEMEDDICNKWPAEVTPGPKKRRLPKSSVKTKPNEHTTDMLVKKAHVPAKQRCMRIGQLSI